MDRLLGEHRISFIKWDLNRSISEPGYPDAVPEHMREVWINHTRAIYDIVDRLKTRHPQVIFQSCSGGGGRIDMGILAFFDQVWPSDNTDAFDRLRIQEGFSYAYGAHFMEAWVTDRKNWVNGRELPLEYRFHACMAGTLGIGDNLTHWDDDERALAQRLIGQYKRIRNLVQGGDLYRLASPSTGPLSALMYVDDAKTSAVLFAFLEKNQFGKRLPCIHPNGLDPKTRYSVRIGTDTLTMSGAAFCSRGIHLPLKGDFSSMILEFTAV